MNIFTAIQEKWDNMSEKTKPTRDKVKKTGKKAGKKVRRFFTGVYRFRGVILAAIVVIFAILLMVFSAAKLPADVGINLQSDGSFSLTVPKLVAVLFPFLITLISLLFVLISKRTLYPFLISMFTLMIPLLILITNVFPS